MHQRALYHKSHYVTGQPLGSYWEATAPPEPPGLGPLPGGAVADVAIIGGGYAGLSTAWHLAREQGLGSIVLEAGPVGWGGSGRNGGFCCLGGDKLGYATIARRHGQDEVRRWFEVQKAGIARVADLAREEAIAIQRAGDGEWLVAHRPRRLGELRAQAETIRRLLGERWPVLDEAALKERALDAPQAHGGIRCPHGFGLHPLAYVRGLAGAALRAGARVHPQTRVERIERAGSGWRLVTRQGAVRAAKVLVTGNGYLDESLQPGLAGRSLPALSSILVTRPLGIAERTAHRWLEPALVADLRRLVFYIRLLPDHRLLFGARGGTDASPAAFEQRKAWMRRALAARFPAFAAAGIDHAWWGLVALSRSRHVQLTPLSEDGSIMALWGCHGSGVALMTVLGRAAAAILAGKAPDPALPGFIQRRAPAFPLPRLRVAGLRAAYAWYHLQDEVL